MATGRALVIGIDDYPTAPLGGCVNDAKAIAARLGRNSDATKGFDVRLLTSDNDDITREVLVDQITELLAQPAPVAVLYFSGHGTLTDFGGHLVAADHARYTFGISSAELGQLVNSSPVHEVVILLDCCNSGAFAATEADAGTALLREGVSLLAASRANQTALESGGAGVFTDAVCEALDGGAADVVGKVTTAGVYAYLDEALGPWDQRPMFKAHLSTLTTLRTCAPAVGLSTLRAFTTWFTEAESHYALDPSYEPTAEPEHPEHEETFAAMQKCRAARLIEPVGEEHMYYAAMNTAACRLTPLGRRYWRLAKQERL